MLMVHQVNRPFSPTITCHQRSRLCLISISGDTRQRTAMFFFCYHLALKLLWWTINYIEQSASVFLPRLLPG